MKQTHIVFEEGATEILRTGEIYHLDQDHDVESVEILDLQNDTTVYQGFCKTCNKVID